MLLYFFVNFIFETFYKICLLYNRVVSKVWKLKKNPIWYHPCTFRHRKTRHGRSHCRGAGKIGKDGSRRALDVKVGDKVIFGKYSGQTVKADGVELLVMREEDIFGIVE